MIRLNKYKELVKDNVSFTIFTKKRPHNTFTYWISINIVEGWPIQQRISKRLYDELNEVK